MSDNSNRVIIINAIIIILLLHTPSSNSVNYYHPRCGNIPRGRRPSGIPVLPTLRVVINTLFNKKECATIVLLYRIGLITGPGVN